MKRTISNGDNIIDSRDVIERIEELKDDRSVFEVALSDAQETLEDLKARPDDAEAEQLVDAEEAVEAAEANVTEWAESDDAAELKVLEALAEEAEGSADWRHGETLIRDSYFEEYAEQLADDIGAISRNASWPVNCIDWKRAAEELQDGYTSVNYDNVIYWIRS